jgi:hypothetical protein
VGLVVRLVCYGAAEGTMIRDALRVSVDELCRLGWHVELEDDSISLRGPANMSPRRNPDVQLDYTAYTVDCYAELDGTQWDEQRKSLRPYCLRSCGLTQTRTFSAQPAALKLFWEQARQLAPAGA